MDKFQLQMAFDPTISGYRVKDFEETYENVKEWAKSYSLSGLKITNEEDAKAVRKSRTEIRKKMTAVADARKEVNRLIVGEFNSQAIAIEKLLKAEDDAMKANLDEYKESHKEAEPPLYGATIVSTDKEAIEKVEEYARKLGCQIQEL